MPEPTTPDCLSILIEREERIARLRTALEAMTPLEQQVLLRRVCAGQPFATVARDLGVDVRAVRLLFANACLTLAGGHPRRTSDGAPSSTQHPSRDAHENHHTAPSEPVTCEPAESRKTA